MVGSIGFNFGVVGVVRVLTVFIPSIHLQLLLRVRSGKPGLGGVLGSLQPGRWGVQRGWTEAMLIHSPIHIYALHVYKNVRTAQLCSRLRTTSAILQYHSLSLSLSQNPKPHLPLRPAPPPTHPPTP